MAELDPRPTLAKPDDDPFLWLEEVEGERALAWVAGQNAATMAQLGGAALEADRDALLAILDRPDNIPNPVRRAGLIYNFWRDAAQPRGIWRRTSLASFRTAAPDWDVLLDLDALAASDAEDWVWHGASTLPPRHDRAVLHLSRGGGDAVVLREFDLVARRFVPDAEGGFNLPQAKGGIIWLDRDTVLLMAALGEGMATTSGYARTVRLWRRGTDPLAASVLFEVAADQLSAWASLDRTNGALSFVAVLGFYDAEVWQGDRTGPTQRLDVPTDAKVMVEGAWLAVKPRGAWTVGGQTYAPDTVLGTSLAAYLAGERAMTVLFTPSPRRAVRGFFWAAGRLVVSVLDNLRPEHLVFDPAAGWTSVPIPGLPAVGTVNVWPLDEDEAESDGSLLATTQTPVEPPRLLLMPPRETSLAAPSVLKAAPPAFDPGAAVVSQHEAVSSDGERIPYVQVGPPGLTGEAPVYMSGYGGFGAPVLPSYRVQTGKLWIERGGTAVSTNLRGGGEFGTWWHEAGRRERKVLSHDDFAAVAADLVRRGVTRPGRIAAEGGSNGGLLIANMLTRYPERFGALFCTIPLIDMRRYHKLLAGASWIAEYGDPDVPADWAFMQAFSAYHTATAGQNYPPTLIATTRRDDRVHPGHARKMAAKLQGLGYGTLFLEPAAGGHGYGSDNAEVALFTALGVRFLRQAIGWD